jgi:hypothetical protein
VKVVVDLRDGAVARELTEVIYIRIGSLEGRGYRKGFSRGAYGHARYQVATSSLQCMFGVTCGGDHVCGGT